MEDAIQPPANAVEIFLGCASDDSDMLKIGVAATPDELFDLKNYPLQTETNGKAVRNFYTYYSNTAIGFSNIPTIQLQQADVYDKTNESKLSGHTKATNLYRCGSTSHSTSSVKIMFFYR